MFVLAVFYALLAPWPDACIAAWVLGMLVDLASANGRIGLFAFGYGATALLILQVREVLFPEHWLSHALLTLVGGLLLQVAIATYRSLADTAPAGSIWGYALLTCLYTVVPWAPLFHGVLSRLWRVTGLRHMPTRRRSVST